MADNRVTISGMFGDDKTYFADSPVVIDISGLEWPSGSPFNIVRVEVVYDGSTVGDFHADTGGQASIAFDISSALRALWSDYDFSAEVAHATSAAADSGVHQSARQMREYALHVTTEYLASDDGGVFTTTDGGTFTGGRCLIGRLTEWERSAIADKADADASHWEHTGIRNGDASTKPTGSPERVGVASITSWVDIRKDPDDGRHHTISRFYSAAAGGSGTADDTPDRADGWTGHAPIVLRDSQEYVDFLFVNRRGAVETCSGRMLEELSIDVETAQYSRVERPTFQPSRSLMAIASGGRRSWSMSSGYQTREWAEWWTLEFLMARQWWMLYNGKYVPVIVTPAKKSVSIYDRSKQQMPHVDFTVTLALEG